MTDEVQVIKSQPGALRQSFGWPPFTVLDFAHGEWQARKKAWISLGLKGEVGRGENLLGFSDQIKSGKYGKALNNSDWVETNGRGRGAGDGAHLTPEELADRKVRGLKGRLNGGGVGKVLDTDGSFWNKEKKGRLGAVYNTRWSIRESVRGEVEPVDGDAIGPQNGEDDAGFLNDTSIFDPVLCELIYTWFSPAGGSVLDPFAGGPTRGIMATKLGLEYHGHELRQEQVEANQVTANEILGLNEKDRVKWYQGDSNVTLEQWETPGAVDFSTTPPTPASENAGFDLVLTCPPYFNLEVYSDDPADISNMDDYDAFLEIYRNIMHKAATKLKNDRFFAVVVGNVRGKANGGAYHTLVSDTIRIMGIAGLHLYNEAILKKPNGSAQFRARKQFTGSRKLVTCHEYLLIFCKGDPKKATEACGDIERFAHDDAVDLWV